MTTIYTGTLDGPHGSRPGAYVTREEHHNETEDQRIRIQQLEALLIKYGHHEHHCQIRKQPMPATCTCGFYAAIGVKEGT